LAIYNYNSNTSLRDGAEAVGEWLYPYLVGAVPTIILLVPLGTLVRVWIIRRTPSVSGKRRYTFSDEGIKIEFDAATLELKWTFYTRIKETRDFFLLYVTGSFCNIVPKRSFVNSEQLEFFRSLVHACAQKCNLKRQGPGNSKELPPR